VAPRHDRDVRRRNERREGNRKMARKAISSRGVYIAGVQERARLEKGAKTIQHSFRHMNTWAGGGERPVTTTAAVYQDKQSGKEGEPEERWRRQHGTAQRKGGRVRDEVKKQQQKERDRREGDEACPVQWQGAPRCHTSQEIWEEGRGSREEGEGEGAGTAELLPGVVIIVVT
jgi:hypothetical protein